MPTEERQIFITVEIMETILIQQHKLIFDRCKDLINVALDEDIIVLQQILNKSKKQLNKYNNLNLTVIDITNEENGCWKSTIKKVVYAKHLNPLVKELRKSIKHDFIDFVCDEHKIYDDGWYYEEEKLCNSCKKELEKREEKERFINNKIEKMQDDFREACNNTVFDKDLKLKNILLNRKIQNIYKTNPLEKALKDTIHTEIIKTFQKQNEKLIIKYN